MDEFVTRFHDKALDYFDPGPKMFADINLHGMMEYRIFLENLSFFYFLRFIEVARFTSQSIQKILGSSSIIQPSLLMKLVPNKRPMIAAIEKGNEAKASRSKKASYSRRKPRHT